jgi:hypothetical protein
VETVYLYFCEADRQFAQKIIDVLVTAGIPCKYGEPSQITLSKSAILCISRTSVNTIELLHAMDDAVRMRIEVDNFLVIPTLFPGAGLQMGSPELRGFIGMDFQEGIDMTQLNLLLDKLKSRAGKFNSK